MKRIRRRAAEWLMFLRQEGDLHPRKLERWLRWMGRNPRHLDAFDDVEALASQLDSWKPVVKERLLRELTQAPVLSSTRPRPLDWRGWQLALAGCTAAVILTVAYLAWTGDLPLSGTSVARDYSTDKGENRIVRLGDGTRIVLGARSQLRVHFDAHRRVVNLQSGEAYFQVRHDASRPFFVFAGKLRIVDVGTEFDVRRDAGQVVVTVGEGVVDIQNEQMAAHPLDAADPLAKSAESATWAGASSSGVQLHAGEQAISGAMDQTPPRVGRTDGHAAGSWRHGRFEFQNESLGTVVANINRYSSREIEIADPSLTELRFTGSVYPDRLDNWLDAVRRVFPVRVEVSESNKVRLYGDGSVTHGGTSAPRE